MGIREHLGGGARESGLRQAIATQPVTSLREELRRSRRPVASEPAGEHDVDFSPSPSGWKHRNGVHFRTHEGGSQLTVSKDGHGEGYRYTHDHPEHERVFHTEGGYKTETAAKRAAENFAGGFHNSIKTGLRKSSGVREALARAKGTNWTTEPSGIHHRVHPSGATLQVVPGGSGYHATYHHPEQPWTFHSETHDNPRTARESIDQHADEQHGYLKEKRGG